MFDDFFIRALIAGVGIALVTGPLGCFIIWRRLAFFGDTLAHSALLGVTLAFTFDVSIALSVFIISSIIALILLKLQKNTKLPGDALLGLLAHSSLAVGLVVIGFLSFIRFDIMGFLFGDILAVILDSFCPVDDHQADFIQMEGVVYNFEVLGKNKDDKFEANKNNSRVWWLYCSALCRKTGRHGDCRVVVGVWCEAFNQERSWKRRAFVSNLACVVSHTSL